MHELKETLDHLRAKVDNYLNEQLPRENESPAQLHQAMRYSLFAGGKRLRPILTLMAAEDLQGKLENALPAAGAVELIHTYSLIHDDLPCMDDDDLRRGRPTCHKKYGEATALLAGDALLTEAFLMLAQTPPCQAYGSKQYFTELAYASSSRQLIGGQVLDLEGEGKKPTQEKLIAIHKRKTAALITSSLRLGAMSAGVNVEQLKNITTFGKNLGLAFQVLDDILDVTQSSEQLGKTAGKDLATEKTTYPALLGIEGAKKQAQIFTEQALDALQKLDLLGKQLESLAKMLLHRER